MTQRHAVLLLAIAVLATTPSCRRTTAPQDVPTTSRATLAVGEAFAPAGTNLRISFDRVNSDSRCPIDVVCVQAGTAEIVISVREDRAGSASQSYVLRSFAEPREVVIGGYRVRLEDVTPSPRAGVPIATSAYRITLSATALPD